MGSPAPAPQVHAWPEAPTGAESMDPSHGVARLVPLRLLDPRCQAHPIHVVPAPGPRGGSPSVMASSRPLARGMHGALAVGQGPRRRGLLARAWTWSKNGHQTPWARQGASSCTRSAVRPPDALCKAGLMARSRSHPVAFTVPRSRHPTELVRVALAGRRCRHPPHQVQSSASHWPAQLHGGVAP